MPTEQTEAPERFGDAGRLAGDPATLNLTGKAGNLCSVSVTLKAQSGRTLREPPMMPPCWIYPQAGWQSMSLHVRGNIILVLSLGDLRSIAAKQITKSVPLSR